MSDTAEGFVYVATGDRYRREAARSAASLRAAHPGARICLIADQRGGPEFWDDFVLLENPEYGFRDKLAMERCPYQRFVFLDTDTLVLGELSECFRLLESFDCIGHQLFEGYDCPVEGVPDAFPEFNTGVLGFRRCPEIEALFAQWAAGYDHYSALNQGGYYHYSNVSDQKSFRQAAYRSRARFAILGPEFNFAPQHVNFACGAVRILHGRGPMADLGVRMNRRLGNRSYSPLFDAIITAEMEPSELNRLWSMASLQLLRRAGVAFIPRRLRDALRDGRPIRRLFCRNDFSELPPEQAATWREPPAPPGTR